nr:DUF2309 domain-containing protein [Rhodothalassium salexigens]
MPFDPTMTPAAGQPATPGQATLTAEAAGAALAQAAGRVAPLWPLRTFVAVNPFLGIAEQTFTRAAVTMAQSAGARMAMPRGFYARAIAEGRITNADLAAALETGRDEAGDRAADLPADVASLKALAGRADDMVARAAALPTVAGVASHVTGEDWARFMTDQISHWAGRHFDGGQALWPSPWRHLPPFAAWRAEAVLDRTPEVMGLKGFSAAVQTLPEDPSAAAAEALALLGVPADGVDAYLHRLVMDMAGWAGYARYLGWTDELAGATDDTAAQFLAVRLAWEAALLTALGAQGVDRAWADARRAYGDASDRAGETALMVDALLQTAYDRGWQRRLIATINGAADRVETGQARPSAQLAFCIDVRSEVYRRALEAVAPDVATIGFAGFFAFPMEYVRLGDEIGSAHCPVPLLPSHTVRESLASAHGCAHGAADDPARVHAAIDKRRARRTATRAWKSFKMAAVSAFSFVETAGPSYLAKLVTDTLGTSRPVPHPRDDGLDGSVAADLAPDISALPLADRVAQGEGALRGLSLTEGFARLVVLVGHGSTTVNNPHAAGLDCGACGGLTGEPNVRIAAAVLNDPEVRRGLAQRGLAVPEDTVFLGAQHDTTTDRVVLFDTARVPDSHKADATRLADRLYEAGARARAERAGLLTDPAGRVTLDGVIDRSRDWSQVRPEWGLAGCAAFVAAPRAFTQHLDLAGKAFLHSYDWQRDDGFGVLEVIMTAPMVVASWISLQYFASTVDNRVFGCGNKVLHNVIGTVGVLEGNAGDLRVGLPVQSLDDGEKLIHDPVRLPVLIAAPTDAIDGVIAKHEHVRHLLDHGWLALYAFDDSGRVAQRYAGQGRWEPVADGAAAQVEAAA